MSRCIQTMVLARKQKTRPLSEDVEMFSSLGHVRCVSAAYGPLDLPPSPDARPMLLPIMRLSRQHTFNQYRNPLAQHPSHLGCISNALMLLFRWLAYHHRHHRRVSLLVHHHPRHLEAFLPLRSSSWTMRTMIFCRQSRDSQLGHRRPHRRLALVVSYALIRFILCDGFLVFGFDAKTASLEKLIWNTNWFHISCFL